MASPANSMIAWKRWAEYVVQFRSEGRCWFPHDSFAWKELADCYLRSEGVDVLYHTNLISAYAADNRVETLLVRCMEGLRAIQPKMVIDASGDAEVVYSIGTPTTMGKERRGAIADHDFPVGRSGYGCVPETRSPQY